MEVELKSIAKVTLEHRHIAGYLAQTDPLDRIVLLRKGLEDFTPDELTILENYIRGGDAIEHKAATLAVCQCARQLKDLAHVQLPVTEGR